jgi:single-strand DNA-binding protein
MFLNRIMLIGNATKDAELRYTDSGKKVSNFTVATNEYWKSPNGEQKSESEFHYITAWDKLAEIAERYIHSGRKIYVEGRKRTTSFDREEQGVLRTVERVEVVAHKIMTLEKAKSQTEESDHDGNF